MLLTKLLISPSSNIVIIVALGASNSWLGTILSLPVLPQPNVAAMAPVKALLLDMHGTVICPA